MSTAWADEAGANADADADAGTVDTIELLQEEIARLEAELRRAEEAAREAPPAPPPEAAPDDARLAELADAVTERDATIGLLCEQLAALEEVGAARAAEWEHMDRWVGELEARLDRDAAAAPVEPEADRDAREAALREELSRRQRAWAAERTRFEAELAELRARPAATGDADGARLESENARLRDEARRLAAAAAEADALRERAGDLEGQLGQSLLKLARTEDDLRRERFEHEAELAALRASLAGAKAAAPAELNVDDRLRAFRQHLQEVHEREEHEREQRQLIHRISRLWRRPGGAS
jgi:chromosome segregation ATPase